MWVFWLVAVLFIVAASAVVLFPLLKTREMGSADRRAMNVEIYKNQFAELENDLKNGTISNDQYQQARADLERALLSDVADDKVSEQQRVEQGLARLYTRAAAIAVALAVPLVSVILYGKLGAGEPGLRPEVASAVDGGNTQHKQIAQMVAGLAEKLKNDPKNLDGWYMLAKSYQFLQRYDDAVAAYEHILKNGGDNNADVYANLADAVAMASGRVLTARSKELLDRALKVDPRHTKALWLAGTAAYQDKELKKALEYWLRLEPVLRDKPQELEQIRGNILETKTALGMDTTADQKRWQMSMGGGDDAPASGGGGGVGASIQGHVKLDASIAKRANANDTVFIFARAAEGPPMPLAVLRKQVRDLPMNFVLDDSMAMSPALRLSSFPRVVVTARISKSGNATAQSGDLQAQGSTVDIGSQQPVQLVINGVVP